MEPSQIDRTILSEVGERWMKVAKVIGRVLETIGSDLPPGDEGCDVISRRIEALVHEGQLAAQGDTRNWRFSEVRLRTQSHQRTQAAHSPNAILKDEKPDTNPNPD